MTNYNQHPFCSNPVAFGELNNTLSDNVDSQTDTNVCEQSESICSKPNVGSDTDKVLVWNCATPFFMYKIEEPLPNSTSSLPVFLYPKLYQASPPSTLGIHFYRNYKTSYLSYEHAVRKQYIILMRNSDITSVYPDHHVILNFHTPMVLDDFSIIRGKAFSRLSRLGVRAFYVHEPSRKGWLHIHLLSIFDGSADVLRENIKQSFSSSGLVYGQDFHVKVKPVNKTQTDFRRLCSYILKFNGKRKDNRRNPLLFLKEVGLRKVGTIGQWFAKSKGEIWAEYIEERRKHSEQVNNGVLSVKPIDDFADYAPTT